MRRRDVLILVQAAIAHAHSETIHPLADGNGRTDRALVHVMLRGRGLTTIAALPTSPGGGDIEAYFRRVGGLQKRARGADYRALRKSGARFGGAGQWLAAELDSVRDEWDQRLHSMRTRNSAAYKGVMALIMANNSKDWMEDKTFGAAQYKDMAVDIHHIFPQAWCNKNGIDDEHRESIVNKTMLSARTNRVIGGVAPSSYLGKIEKATQLSTDELDALLEPHLVEPELLRNDEFARFFDDRRKKLCQLVETAIGKPVPRDVSTGAAEEDSAHFEESEM